jgi:hypothetical protein
MNVRIRFNTEMRTAAWFGDEFLINNFAVNLQLITQSQNPNDHSVCMGRVRTVIDQLEHSIFVNQDNTEKINELIGCGLRVTAFPQEPIDQIVGIVLFEKINTVLEGRMRVTDLDICSDLGDNIWFMHGEHEKVSAISDSGWWADASPTVCAAPSSPTKTKVVKMRKSSNWKSLDLEWQSDQPSETVIINIKDDK